MTITTFGDRPPKVGDEAIDFELLDIEGQTASLSAFWREKPLALIFLRHLGCTFCRQQLAWLRRDYAGFQSAGANVVCIAQGIPKVGKTYAIAFDLPFPLLLCGDDLTIYRQYGLLRGTASQLLSPRVLLRGLASFLQGHIQTKVEGNGSQLGGGFIVDTNGIVRYAYRSQDFADTVRNADLIDALHQVRRGS